MSESKMRFEQKYLNKTIVILADGNVKRELFFSYPYAKW